MLGIPDHEQAMAYLLIEIRDLRVHLERAETHIVVITEELARREKRGDALEAALREIMDHPHCGVDSVLAKGPWHSDGHKCCAEIARKALEK